MLLEYLSRVQLLNLWWYNTLHIWSTDQVLLTQGEWSGCFFMKPLNPKPLKVVNEVGAKYPHNVTSNIRSQVTVLACTSAAGYCVKKQQQWSTCRCITQEVSNEPVSEQLHTLWICYMCCQKQWNVFPSEIVNTSIKPPNIRRKGVASVI